MYRSRMLATIISRLGSGQKAPRWALRRLHETMDVLEKTDYRETQNAAAMRILLAQLADGKKPNSTDIVILNDLYTHPRFLEIAEDDLQDSPTDIIGRLYEMCDDMEDGEISDQIDIARGLRQEITQLIEAMERSQASVERPKKTPASQAIFIQEIEVTDPDSEAEIEIEIYKDPLSGCMFGLDSAMVDQIGIETIQNPFLQDETIQIPEPPAAELKI